jgi:hypothetical protein
VLAGDSASAVLAAAKAESLLWSSPGFLIVADYHFYAALALAAAHDAAPHHASDLMEQLRAHHKRLEIWAENGPENFQNRAALVGAEMARIEGRELDAERLYEAAIKSARENEFANNEALANELAARFHAARGYETIANAYRREARSCYVRWGADGKVRQLDQLYPRLRDKAHAVGPTSTIGATLEYLDLATVIKLSQAVSPIAYSCNK